ncbi:MAG TPA: hypothetical protein VHO91_14655 [Rhodopila sp.]|nr:hypothetical protein [Rhodopila sp.]
MRKAVFLSAFLAGAALLGAATARAADPPVTEAQAIALFQSGQHQQALRAFDQILAAHPADPAEPLFYASTIRLENADWQTAKPMIERLMKLRPSLFAGWELMVQVDQAAGDKDGRDDAIDQLYAIWRTTTNPAIRARTSFLRDRIFTAKHTLLAYQMLDSSGDDATRFVFLPAGRETGPRHMILVHADRQTNEQWWDSGQVPQGTVVWHLDSVEQLPEGQQAVRAYRFYVKAPKYDDVRAKITGILNGSARPMTGEPDPFWTR